MPPGSERLLGNHGRVATPELGVLRQSQPQAALRQMRRRAAQDFARRSRGHQLPGTNPSRGGRSLGEAELGKRAGQTSRSLCPSALPMNLPLVSTSINRFRWYGERLGKNGGSMQAHAVLDARRRETPNSTPARPTRE